MKRQKPKLAYDRLGDENAKNKVSNKLNKALTTLVKA